MIAKFLFFFLVGTVFSSFVVAEELALSDSYQSIFLQGSVGERANLGLPVSIVRLDDDYLAVASYLNIWLLNEESGFVRELKKPEGVSGWYPTGLAFDKDTQELYVANYLGKDVLIFGRKKGEFFLKHRVQDVDLVGPENIALSRDGKFFAVADFDNNGVLLFDRKSNKKIWHAPLGRAHGLDFDSSGEKIVAAGLAPPQVVSLDLQGKLLTARGIEGWGVDGYLWPTGVATDPATHQTWVTDAHLGRIRALNDVLEEQQVVGGNGLGLGLFNMPYGVLFEPDGRLWVADTFKSRILLLDKDKKILRTYLSSPEVLPGLLSCASGECLVKASPYPKDVVQSMGTGYDKRVNASTAVAYDFGVYGLQSWNTGFNYNAFNHAEAGQLAMAGASPLFSSSIYYWIQAGQSEGQLVFGSPQVREWIVDYQGIGCPVSLGLNYWMVNGVLRSDQHPDFSLKALNASCEVRMANWETAVNAGQEPFGAFADHVLGKQREAALTLLASVFQSENGKAYYQALCLAHAAEQRKQLSQAFISSLSGEELVFLPELWIARIFAFSKGDVQGGSVCVNAP